MHPLAIPRSPSTYQVSIPVYEGPLDLLLQLIERAELDITKVALAQVTDQYLAYIHAMEEIGAEEISEFLAVAAKLLQIKSEALLPRPPIRELGEEDLGESLARQLIIYKEFKRLAEFLAKQEHLELRTYLRIAPPPKVDGKLDFSNITTIDLLTAAEAILLQEQEKVELSTVIAPPKVTIREKISLIAKSLKSNNRITFNELIGIAHSRLEIVVTFLALLELVKRYRVAARQDGLFCNIEIESLEEWRDDEEFEIEFE